MPHTKKQGTIAPDATTVSDGAKQSTSTTTPRTPDAARRNRIRRPFAGKTARTVCTVNKFRYLCNAVHSKGETIANYAGIFISAYIGSILPCRCLMARLPFEGVQQRVGIEPFYLHIVKLS